MEKLFDKINDNERNLILKEFEAATLNYKKSISFIISKS